MTKYVDLNVIIDNMIHHDPLVECTVLISQLLGYDIVTLSTFSWNNVRLLKEKVRELQRSYDIDIAIRLSIRTRDPRLLKGILRRYRRMVDIISVYCETNQVASFAAKDHRVDTLVFPLELKQNVAFDEAKANLSIQGETALEIVFWDVMKAILSRKLIPIKRWVDIALSHDVPIVVSSGASHYLELRAPRELIAFASIVLELPNSKEALYKYQVERIEINRRKLSGEIPLPGVKIIGKGERPYDISEETLRNIQDYKPRWGFNR